MKRTRSRAAARPAEEEDEVTSDSESPSSDGRVNDSAGSSSDSEEREDGQAGDSKRRRETPEQKRLRLAKAYLRSMEIEGGGQEGGEEESGTDEDGVTDPKPVDISERLKVEALAQRGHYQRKIADGVSLPEEGCSRLICRPMKRQGGGGFHRKSLTGVCIPGGDGTKCYSVSKCGALVGWDLDTLSRNNTFTYGARQAQRSRPSGPASTSAEPLYSVCCSDDGRTVVTGGHSGTITAWDARSGEVVKTFEKVHKAEVTGLTFQSGTQQLFSCSRDRTVKIWSLDDMAYVDTLFGHVQGCTQIDCLRKERVISVGEDRTCRLWKVQDETQLLFKGTPCSGNVDACCFVNGTTFVTGSQDSSVSLWSMFKKRPVYTVRGAHGSHGDGDGSACSTWVHSLAACANTDLVASGGGDGRVTLYRVDPEDQTASERMRAVGEVEGVEGYVNALAFNAEGTVLVAGAGQEPRLGRWGRNPSSKNALYIQRLALGGAGNDG